MDYNKAVKAYIDLRDQVADIEREAKERVAGVKEKMEKLSIWIEQQASKDGLEKVPTKYGTVFWTVVDSCSVQNSTAFFDFVRENEAWELLEKRASKLAVRDYIQTHNNLPPGIDYSTRKSINVRSKT